MGEGGRGRERAGEGGRGWEREGEGGRGRERVGEGGGGRVKVTLCNTTSRNISIYILYIILYIYTVVIYHNIIYSCSGGGEREV